MISGWEETPHRSKKNTKRWCKGKVGVEHQWKQTTLAELRGWPGWAWAKEWKMKVCTVCGRQAWS